MNIHEIARRTALLMLLLLLAAAVLPQRVDASDLGLTEADCRCCHGPTLADRHHLLVNTHGLECLSCHTMNYNPSTIRYEPTVTRDCLQCHTGSLADRHHLLVDQVVYTCFNCHTMAYDPVSMSYSPDFNVSCQTPPPAIPLGQVTGSVRDTGGAPLAWTRVATVDGTYSTLTTETGTYALVDLPAGTHTLVATLGGFVAAGQAVSVGDGLTSTANFVLNPLVTPGTITGVVRDTKLNPLPGATVASPDGLLSATTGVNGTFALVDVAPGSYLLTAEKSGYAPAGRTVTVANGQTLDAPFTLPNLPREICGDGIDNDSNGLTDCADPACMSSDDCLLPVVEVCGDGIDNDGNGLTDCDDPICAATSNCLPPPVEICDDGIDNDGDGLFDCDDGKCAGHPSCFQPIAEEHCANGIDDNGDGLVDCADSQCRQRSLCLVEICGEGRNINYRALASDSESFHKAANGIDGDLNTRWWVNKDKDQWLRVDLRGIYRIDQVTINWHSEYAETYKLRVSKDGRYWTTVKKIDGGDGGFDTLTFSARNARFILIDCGEARSSGFSIRDLQIRRVDCLPTRQNRHGQRKIRDIPRMIKRMPNPR
jgi:predicted CXXCH cytochrome family protein